MQSSFEIIDLFDIRAKFFEEYTIFKKNSVKKMGKSIFPNLMSSALFGYISGYTRECKYYRFYDEYKSVHKQI